MPLVKGWEVVTKIDNTPARVRVENIALRNRTILRTDKTQVKDVQRGVKSLSKQNNNLLDSMVGRFGTDNKQVTWNSTQAIDTRDLYAHLVLRDRAQFAYTGHTRIMMTARIVLTANSCVAPISAVKVLFAF